MRQAVFDSYALLQLIHTLQDRIHFDGKMNFALHFSSRMIGSISIDAMYKHNKWLFIDVVGTANIGFPNPKSFCIGGVRGNPTRGSLDVPAQCCGLVKQTGIEPAIFTVDNEPALMASVDTVLQVLYDVRFHMVSCEKVINAELQSPTIRYDIVVGTE